MRTFFRAWFTPPHNKLCAGFTLLETVIAVTLLFVATMGPVTLMTKSLSDFQASRNKLIALHLAQEGIELVRVVREHNAICDVLAPGWPWDRDSDGTGTIRGNNLRADATQWTDAFTCGGVPYVNPNFSQGCSNPLMVDGNGRYGYIAGNATIFNRCIDVRTPPGGPEDGILPSDMMDVISTVTWAERRGPTRIITLQTRLYHWK